MLNPLRDGHIHSPYCPHGSLDPLKFYVEKALEKGLNEMTFTEHMPLPGIFMQAEVLKESSPTIDKLKGYFEEIEQLKVAYKGEIVIHAGLEVDYIEGYEEKTKELLEGYGPKMQDSILSIHFMKIENAYYCIDYSPKAFGEIVHILGSVEKLYDRYYETLLKAIQVDLGPFKPKRIGHPTLVRLFNKQYPIDYQNKGLLENIIKEIKVRGYTIDCNTAGLRKRYCLETYPSGLFMKLAKEYDVPMVYGSDAHIAQDVGRDFI